MMLETFSFLPPLTADEVRRQIEYVRSQDWLPIIEYSADPSESLWSWWTLPMLDAATDDVMSELDACADTHPDAYVRVIGFDPRDRRTARAAFVVHRPR